MLRRLALIVFLVAGALNAALAEPALYARPEERAFGNRRADAIALARSLLTEQQPATVEEISVDGVEGHEVAGIVVSGVKFHRALRAEDFLAEASLLIARSFAHSGVEEVDFWARVPIRVPKGTIVNGDLAAPVYKTVFGCTARRADLARLDALLRDPADVYWEPAFAERLGGAPAPVPGVSPSASSRPASQRTGKQPRQSASKKQFRGVPVVS